MQYCNGAFQRKLTLSLNSCSVYNIRCWYNAVPKLSVTYNLVLGCWNLQSEARNAGILQRVSSLWSFGLERLCSGTPHSGTKWWKMDKNRIPSRFKLNQAQFCLKRILIWSPSNLPCGFSIFAVRYFHTTN